jgi:hypothetical protein
MGGLARIGVSCHALSKRQTFMNRCLCCCLMPWCYGALLL